MERIKKANISLYRDIDELWYDTGSALAGQLEFLVQDPDGYLLRFTQYLGEKTNMHLGVKPKFFSKGETMHISEVVLHKATSLI